MAEQQQPSTSSTTTTTSSSTISSIGKKPFPKSYGHYAKFLRDTKDMYPSTESQNAALPATMKALLLTSREEPLSMEAAYPTPQAGPGSLVVQVLVANVVSYSGDVYSGRRPYPMPLPLVPGPMAIGRVAAVGPDSTGLRNGQLVMVDATIRSRDVADGADSMLLGFFGGNTVGGAHLIEGEWRNGTYAQYVRLPLENVFPFDESVTSGLLGYDASHLSAMSRLTVPFGGLDDIGVKAGETVIVFPASGPFGSGAVQVALAMGAGKVLALGRNMTALEKVAGFAAPGRVVPVRIQNDPEKDGAAIQEALGEGKKADAFFDISPPQAQDSTHFGTCLRMLRIGGRVSLMGGIGGDVQLPHGMIMRGNLTIKGTYMCSPAQVRRLIQLVESGRLDLTKKGGMETSVYKMEQWQEAFDFAAANPYPGINVVLEIK